MIHAASRAAQAELRTALGSDLPARTGTLVELPAELHNVSRLLETQPRLRRTLGDGSSSPERRSELAGNLFTGKVSATAVALVSKAVGLRWSNPWDLTDGLSMLGDEVLLDSAHHAGRLDNVEDELFRFGRILRAQDELRGLLDEQAVPADRRVALMNEVLAGKVDPVTVGLLDQAVRSGRKRTMELAIDDLLERTASLRNQSIADVTSAIVLSDEQEQRLGATLSQLYGRTITVRTQVDRSVQGGLIIRIGNEIIDGSVAHRLAVVRSELAG